MSNKLKNKITYGYYIDEDGLYFKSEKDGEALECFDINGVASVSLQFGEIDILHLCYITDEDDDILDG
tara:strand:+ start:1397 stop:1600 length:204 start_codon:yes stop_codon:yes gene_type:complete